MGHATMRVGSVRWRTSPRTTPTNASFRNAIRPWLPRCGKSPANPLLLAPPPRSINQIWRQLGMRAINVANCDCLLTRTRPAEKNRHDMRPRSLVAVTSTGDWT